MRTILVVIALFCTSAQAELYTCKVTGKTTLTDVPCKSKKGRSETPPEEEKTAAQIQAEFEREIADKRAAEIAKAEAEKKAEQDRQMKAAEIRHYIEMAPTRAAQGAAQIRSAMRDPDSFRLTLAVSDNTTGTICYVYRSKNGFGGYVSGSAMLIGYDLLFSNTSGFSSRWEIECTSNSRTNYTAAINRLVL